MIRYVGDLAKIFAVSKSVRVPLRHKAVMENAGVEFYEEDDRFVKESSVLLCGFGGIGTKFIGADNLEELRNQLFEAIGAAASFSYMTVDDTESLASRGKRILERSKHYGVCHAVSLNIGVFGVSSAVEHEFDCQRDLVHLSRLTVARTKAQSKPCFVVLKEKHLPIIKKVVDATEAILNSDEDEEGAGVFNSSPQDLEVRNALFPSLKATSFLLSGTLANFRKLAQLQNDGGKEDEFRDLAVKIGAIVDMLLTGVEW